MIKIGFSLSNHKYIYVYYPITISFFFTSIYACFNFIRVIQLYFMIWWHYDTLYIWETNIVTFCGYRSGCQKFWSRTVLSQIVYKQTNGNVNLRYGTSSNSVAINIKTFLFAFKCICISTIRKWLNSYVLTIEKLKIN